MTLITVFEKAIDVTKENQEAEIVFTQGKHFFYDLDGMAIQLLGAGHFFCKNFYVSRTFL